MQQRQFELETAQAKIEVLPEAAVRDRRPERPRRCGDHPDAATLGALGPDRRHLPGLQKPQEAELQGLWQLADLIEKNRAAIRRADQTDPLGRRPRKGAIGVAEQFGLEQTVGDRGAILHDERPGPAG